MTTAWSPGAAGLYKAAELTGCPAHTAMLATRVNPADLAAQVDVPVDTGQAPTAITRGKTFERSITKNGARRLLQALREQAAWPEGPLHVLDLDEQHPTAARRAPDAATLAARAARTAHCVDARSAGKRAPDVILQADLVLRLGDQLWRVRPDLLLSRPGTRHYVVGEIKSWPDRGARTDSASLGAAMGQLAAAHLALGQSPARGGSSYDGATGVLVLARGYTLAPAITTVSLAREVDALKRFHPVLAAAASRHAGAAQLQAHELLGAGTRLTEACQARCALYQWCRHQARDQESPTALGDRAAADLGVVSLAAAASLALGSSEPTTRQEQAVADAGAAWRTAVQW